jgi:hypothetical protein
VKRKHTGSRTHRLNSSGKLSLAEDEVFETFDPYDRHPHGSRNIEPPTRTDLRKLSEWIKLKRDVEALKKDDDEDAA